MFQEVNLTVNQGKEFEISKIQYSSLAQSVEHLTVNQVVAGSSPAGGAKNPSKFHGFEGFSLPKNGFFARFEI